LRWPSPKITDTRCAGRRSVALAVAKDKKRYALRGRRQIALAVAKDKRYALRGCRQIALAVAKDKRYALHWHDAKDKIFRLNWYDGMWDCMMGCGIISCLCCVFAI
jgi:hypothetical protein